MTNKNNCSEMRKMNPERFDMLIIMTGMTERRLAVALVESKLRIDQTGSAMDKEWFKQRFRMIKERIGILKRRVQTTPVPEVMRSIDRMVEDL